MFYNPVDRSLDSLYTYKMSLFWLLIFLLFFPKAQAATEAVSDRRVELERQQILQPTELKLPFTPKNQAENKQKLDDLQVAFLRTLPPRKVVLRHDLCQIISILTGQKNSTIEDQIKWMNDKGFIPLELKNNFDPMKPLTKGLAAYTFCKLMNIKGGLIMRTFGLSQRYALKELIDLRMMQGASGDTVSGEELLILVTRAVEYMTRQKTPKQ